MKLLFFGKAMRYFLFCFLFLFHVTVSAHSYIIDTDMGFDDWLAVLYLLKQPVHIDAITVDCEGETRCPEGAINASKLTYLAQRNIPIAYGETRPQSKYDFPKKIRDFATAMAIPGFLHLKKYHHIVLTNAAEFIVKNVIFAAKHHKKVSIISIGTAVNIADAWMLAKKTHQEKLFRLGLKMIYKGGGAFGKIRHHHLSNQEIPGNITIPGTYQSTNTSAEWNIYANAPAMKIVLQANLPITFIPNNATDGVPMTIKVYEQLHKGAQSDSIRLFSANALQDTLTLTNDRKNIPKNLDFWDTSVTMAALHPEIVTQQFHYVPIEIVLQTGKQYAETKVVPHSTHTVTVYDHFNKNKFYQNLFHSI